MQKIVPCLWFDGQAEEAVNFYASIFKNSKILKVSYYGEEGYEIHKKPAGSILTIEFELDGNTFTALNGGPEFTFNEAISFQVPCDTQEEIDYYWEKLNQGGDKNAQQCGWLKDKYGVSWQVFPKILPELLRDKDKEKAGRVMNAMMQMKKIDLATLENA